MGVDLHLKDAYGVLSFDDLGPDVGMGFDVLADEIGIVGELKCLAEALHDARGGDERLRALN